jgi:hypothetical protein
MTRLLSNFIKSRYSSSSFGKLEPMSAELDNSKTNLQHQSMRSTCFHSLPTDSVYRFKVGSECANNRSTSTFVASTERSEGIRLAARSFDMDIFCISSTVLRNSFLLILSEKSLNPKFLLRKKVGMPSTGSAMMWIRFPAR